MLLRHLIVLIIDARNRGRRSCTIGVRLSSGWNETASVLTRRFDRSDQKTKIHVLELIFPGYGSSNQRSIS